MFEQQTTIILGAGASHQFGFPLGGMVRSEILSGIRGLITYVKSNSPQGLPAIGAHNVGSFQKDPFVALASYLASPLAREYLPANFPWKSPAEALRAFGEDLARETHDSVDRFIRDNPRHQFIGKALIGQSILLRMYSFGDDWLDLRQFSEPQMGNRRNWYRQLINIIREGAKSAGDLRRNRLQIVTFNYDLSLERALAACLDDTELHKGIDYLVNILHVNGAPAELPARMTDVGKFLLTCGRVLHLVDEDVNADIKEVRAKARSAIAKTGRIYIMGFHFDDANIATIGLRDAPNKARIFSHNFDGHRGVTQKIIKLGCAADQILMGTPDKPVFIDQAIDQGFLEQ